MTEEKPNKLNSEVQRGRNGPPPKKKARSLTSDRDSPNKRIRTKYVVERTEKYRIQHSYTIKPNEFNNDHPDLQNCSVCDAELMLKGRFCNEEKIQELWNQKSRMDVIFDSGQDKHYYEVRDKIFPQDKKGSNLYRNRAGDKLNEVDEAVHIFPTQSITFLDICGGPGAFSQLLLEKTNCNRGYGITLNCKQTWYKELYKNNLFTICIGADGSGNIYIPENLDSVEQKIRDDGEISKLNLCVADGGFEIKKNDKGEHMENFQELYSGHIIISELLLTMKTLQPGGNFVCKLFDAFSCITQSVIYITTQIFEEVWLVKPLRSRIVNSEKYLVGKSLKISENFEFFKNLLSNLHRNCTEKSCPRSLVPVSIMYNDENFYKTSYQSCDEMCMKQTKALLLVMNEVEEVISDNKNVQNNK